MLVGLIIWAILAIAEVCGAPAVSLSFGGKPRNDTGVVLSYRNGSWVVGTNNIHTGKSSQVKKGDRVNDTSELDDLFRRINLASKKIAPGSKPMRGTSEKPLGELFLEWLSKHGGNEKPVAKSTPIPLVGLQIDFDEDPSTASRDFRMAPNLKFPMVDLPSLLGQSVRKNPKSYDLRPKLRHSPIHRPVNYLGSDISQVNQRGSNSDDVSTQCARKRRKYDDDSVKFVIEPLTILPFDLIKSDLADSLSNTDDSQDNLTKRETKAIKDEDAQNNGNLLLKWKLPRSQQVRRQRSSKELLTMTPTKAQPVQSKVPKFDEALPVQSHVKKRHGKLIMNPKPETITGASTLDPTAEESYSGQLVVHNEIPGDRKNKLNDLPKYVMKFLSQCKALMEQNYDEGAKDIDDDEGLLSHNDSAINNSIQHPTQTATTHALSADAEVDEFDAISINKRPLKKKKAKDQNSLELPADGESAAGGSQLKRTNEQAKSGPRNLIPAYDGDDLYDDDLEFGVDGNKQSEDKVNRKTYYTSVNSSSCKSIIEDYAASTEVYNNCSEAFEATTLSPGQWKVLMDMLNERAPCPTTKRPTTRKKSTKEPTTVCSTSMAADGNGRMTPKQQQDTSAEPKPTRPKQRVQTAKTTCGTSLTPCANTLTRTTTCSTTTCSTTTCSRRTHATTTIEPCDNTEIEATTEDCSETTVLRNIKQKNKPVIPQRYFIKVENPKPKLHKEALLQGRPKANNWLENIKNMKLLESLRLNQNPMKPSFVLNPKSANPGGPNDPDGAERMLAEGVIPLKTGSTLNLYISYVLNKTKANKGKAGQEHKVPEEVDQQEPT